MARAAVVTAGAGLAESLRALRSSVVRRLTRALVWLDGGAVYMVAMQMVDPGYLVPHVIGDITLYETNPVLPGVPPPGTYLTPPYSSDPHSPSPAPNDEEPTITHLDGVQPYAHLLGIQSVPDDERIRIVKEDVRRICELFLTQQEDMLSLTDALFMQDIGMLLAHAALYLAEAVDYGLASELQSSMEGEDR